MLIFFNDERQYESIVINPFAYDIACIDAINVDNSDNAKIKYFNIFGVEVDESYRGIVISSDGHKTIRKSIKKFYRIKLQSATTR